MSSTPAPFPPPGATCQTDVGPLRRVLLKRPDDAFGSQQAIDSQWEALRYLAPPDLELARKEHADLTRILEAHGATVEYVGNSQSRTSEGDGPGGDAGDTGPAIADRATGLDSLYVRDASIATDRGMILCSMGKEARRGEPHEQERHFREAGIPVLGRITGEGRLEGGDVAWLDARTLAVARGYRTNEEGIRQLGTLLGPEIHLEVMHSPHYRGPDDVFHLMSVFSPLDHDLALVYSPLMSVPFREMLLDRGIRFVEVPEEEFDTLGCNALALAPRICLIAEGNPITVARLRSAGVEVHEFAGREISLKGSGGPTCLTRPLERRL